VNGQPVTDAPPLWLLVSVAAVLGAVIGSFLNVCIHRLPRGESVVHPRSKCPKCGRMLRWYENVPILSWMVLRARCAGCGEPISPMYPLVEAATAITYAAAMYTFGVTPLLPVRLLFASAMIVLAVTDLNERILPNTITYPGVVAGLLFSLFLPPGIVSALIGVVLGGGVPFLIGEIYYRVRRIEGLGMGDVKMLAMIGAFLGWQLALFTLFLASLLGVAVGVPLTRIKGDRFYQIPLGTFLAIGALVAVFVGDPIVAWYAGLYR
jgi:leader peptidase (prepilin peptidase)/N-methyltransferase